MDVRNNDIAEKNYHELRTAKLKELYDEEFLEHIVYAEDRESGKKYYHTNLFNCQTLELACRLMGEYRGEMVGVKGGFKKDERYAVVILETVYRLEERLLPKLVEKLEPEIKEYVSRQVEEDRVSEAVREEKEKFTRHLETDFDQLSNTNRMVPRRYLEDVCKETKEYFPDKGFVFKQHFPELEGIYSDEFWERDKQALAVVKYGAWKLMISHLGWKDTENDK